MIGYIVFQVAEVVGFMLLFLFMMFLLLIAIIGLIGGGIYKFYKFLFGDEYQDSRDSLTETAVETGKAVDSVAVETGKAFDNFTSSTEGKVALSVLECVADYYNVEQSRDTTSSISNTNNTFVSTDQSDQPELQQLETEIRKQGIDPYEPAHDADIEQLLNDIEQDGTNWK